MAEAGVAVALVVTVNLIFAFEYISVFVLRAFAEDFPDFEDLEDFEDFTDLLGDEGGEGEAGI